MSKNEAATFTRTAAAMVAENDRVPAQRTGRLSADDLATIERLHAEHPVESCDLFRSTTGRCTCAVGGE